MNASFSNLLHRAAEKWGFQVIDGKPLIDDRTNPYPKPEVCETLQWKNGKYEDVTIELFVINGQWGYALNANFSEGGFGYGPSLHFCDPYPTRNAALRAAHAELQKHVDSDKRAGYRYRSSGPALTWLEKLSKPEQLALFAL